MTSAYFTKGDLEDRLSADVVRKCYDDNNIGTADSSPLGRLIRDASSKVDSYLRGMYPLPLATVPNEVQRLALDVAEAFAAKRFPEIVRKDWKELLKQAEKELESLRMGKTRLDVPTGQAPDPPANVGARVGSRVSDDGEETGGTFDKMGDF